jgi:hypothetical protein
VLDRKKSFRRGTFGANVKRDSDAALRRQPWPGTITAPTNLAPDTAGWTLDLAGASTPDAPAAGRIHGQAFAVEQSRLTVGRGGMLLELRQGKDFFAERAIRLNLYQSNPAELGGRTIRWPADDLKAYRPTVFMVWAEPGQHFPRSVMIDRFVMRIEFDEFRGSQLSARIYLCVSEQEKSFVRGKFVATVQKSTPPPAGLPRPSSPSIPPGFPGTPNRTW